MSPSPHQKCSVNVNLCEHLSAFAHCIFRSLIIPTSSKELSQPSRQIWQLTTIKVAYVRQITGIQGKTESTDKQYKPKVHRPFQI